MDLRRAAKAGSANMEIRYEEHHARKNVRNYRARLGEEAEPRQARSDPLTGVHELAACIVVAADGHEFLVLRKPIDDKLRIVRLTRLHRADGLQQADLL